MSFDVMAVLAKAMSYTDESIAGGGAIKGKNCQIKSKTAIEGGTRITFAWYLDNGTEQTTTLDIMNGTDGEDGKDGSQVEVTPIQKTGTKVGEITVDGHKYTLYAPAGGGGGDAVLSDDLTTAISVGGIDSGVTYEAGTPLETLLRDLLEPTLFPMFTNPSASLTATGAKLLEKGATLATTFTIAFNRGTINPQYTAESSYRSGEATGYSLNGGTAQAGNTFSVTVTEAQKTYQGNVAYAQGVQPKDSKGKDYQSPLPAGSVNTNTINYEFVDALWANTGNIATVAKLALVSKSAKQKDFAFPAQTVVNPEIFDVPASWNVTAVQVKNDLSGAYEDAISQFTVTDVTHDDASGTSVAYKRYTFNLGYDTGARSVRLKWN